MNIIEYIPYGKDNAISRKQLCNLSGLPDRMMRKEIERARQEYAILNSQDGQGYFIPLPEERPLVLRWMRQERSREKSVKQSTLGAEKFLTGSVERENIVLVHGYTRRKNKTDGEPQVTGQMRL